MIRPGKAVSGRKMGGCRTVVDCRMMEVEETFERK